MRPQSAHRREVILDAAAGAIARHGFHGMSMRELARETGQALAGFYNYFSSKHEVLYEIQKSAFGEMIASAAAALGAIDSPRERLFAFIAQHVRYVAAHPDTMRVLIHEASALPPRERAIVRKLKERYFEFGRAILAELHPAGERELEHVSYGIFGMLNWMYSWYEPERHGPPDEVARSLYQLAHRGVEASA